MKKHLVMFVAMLLVVAVAMPAFAAVEFKYGGQFRVRMISADNNYDANDQLNDNQNFLDQRMRLYFTFQASENLKLVWKLEVGDVVWGRSGGRIGPGTGGEPGADGVNVETKNAYVEFNIPATPVTGIVGIQGIALMNSWIVDDDFAAAVLKAKLDPVTVQAGYVAGQVVNATTWQERIDSWFTAVDFKQGPVGASLVGYYQFGHNTLASADPNVMFTPFTNPIPWGKNTITTGSVLGRNFDIDGGELGSIKDNNLIDIGLNVEFKMNWMSAYLTFVKNLGGVDYINETLGTKGSADYQGFMFDAGTNFFCGPFTFNVGGFYTTGDEYEADGEMKDREINRFVYPLSTQKYFSELIGGGILDHNPNIAHTDAAGKRDYQWEGYGWPSNIWTVTAGAAWQVLDKTKLSTSYWYFGSSQDVVGKDGKMANDIGHEIDFYVTQGIVDGLTLDLVGAYLITGDAYTAQARTDNAYEVGARLQWNF